MTPDDIKIPREVVETLQFYADRLAQCSIVHMPSIALRKKVDIEEDKGKRASEALALIAPYLENKK